MLDILRLFTLAVHLSTFAWTSPRTPTDAVLDIIATHNVRNITFSPYVRVSLLDTINENLNLPGNNAGTILTPSCGELFVK